MKYEVLVQPPALEDIEGAYRWLAERTPAKAAEWYNGLVETILSLERHPERCSIAPESGEFEEDIRQLFHGKGRSRYRILFIIRGKKVHVLHVRHGARRYLRVEPPANGDV